jgi:hypothetical protein
MYDDIDPLYVSSPRSFPHVKSFFSISICDCMGLENFGDVVHSAKGCSTTD